MKILEFTDVHITRSCEFNKPTDDGLNEYLQLVVKSFEFVKQSIVAYKPDLLVFGGDWFDANDMVDTLSINVGTRILSDISSLVQAKLAIVGNHDYMSSEHGIHTLELFKLAGWAVAENPLVTDPNIFGKSILAVPHRDSYDLDELIPLIAKADIAFTHSDIYGALRRAPKGENDKKAYSDGGLDPYLFSDLEAVFNGHYHHPSQVTPNFYNVGSLTSRTFHDKGSAPRGIVLYDTETKTIERKINPYARPFEEIRITSLDDLDKVFEEDHTNSYARIHYDLDLKDDVLGIEDSFAGARLLPIKKEKQGATPLDFDLRFSLRDNLERYLKEHDHEAIIDTALEIFDEAAEDHQAAKSRSPLDFGIIDIHNFQLIEHVQLDLHRQGLVFIKGVNDDDSGEESNASGKSTVIEAIYWVLTGKSLRGYKVNEVIKWGSDYVRVSLEVLTGDSVYTIIRSRKDPEYGTGLHIYPCRFADITEDTVSAGARLKTDTEDRLADIIGRSEKSLRHVCFLTSNPQYKYSSLNQAQRAKLLEEIIDCEPYRLARDISKKRLRTSSDKLLHTQGSLSSLIDSRNQVSERVKELHKLIADYDSTNEGVLTSLNYRISQLNNAKGVAESRKQELHTILSGIESTMTPIASKVFMLSAQRDALQKELTEASSNLAVFDSRAKHYQALSNQKLCPTCEEPIQEKNIKDKLRDVLADLEVWKIAKSEATSKISSLDKKLEQLRLFYREKQAACTAINGNIRSKDSEINSIVQGISTLEKEVEGIGSQKRALQAQLDEREKEAADLTPKISSLLDEEEKLVNETHTLGTLVDDVFNEAGVRSSVLTQIAVPFINSILPDYTSQAFGGKSVEISYEDLSIVQPGPHSYLSNSNGQRARIDCILQLCLSDLATATGRSRIGFIGIDEMLEFVDDMGILNLIEVLKRKAEDRTIFLISHSKYAASISHRQLVFHRKNGTTSLFADTTKGEVMP